MSETITDILREMRALAAKVDVWDGNVETSYIRDYADRIENAYNRNNARLRALVKEMADALNSNKCAHCCMPCLSCNQRTKQLSLVAKAREVSNG